jgi:hypothetical protein
VPVPFNIQVGVYNSAGELVRTLYQGSSQSNGLNPQLSAPSFLSGQALTIQFAGQLGNGSSSLSWTGINDQGQLISAGIYYLRIQSVDPFGKTTTSITAVSVLGPSTSSSATIYNSAGEVVARLALPAGFGTLASVEPLKPSYVVGASSAPLQFQAVNVSGTTTVLSWNGQSSAGTNVSSGTYTVLVTSAGKSGTMDQSSSFTVIDQGSSRSLDPYAKNPLGPSDTVLSMRFTPPSSGMTHLALYNAAGELVASALDMDGSGRADLQVRGLAGGTYLCVLSPEGPGTRVGTSVFKVAIIR